MGPRTEHLKPFYPYDFLAWGTVAEAIEQNVMPSLTRQIFRSTTLAQQLLKKDDNGRFTMQSGTRPIGKGERLVADALRARASAAAHAVGAWLTTFGQWALGVASGGEAAATASQIKMDANYDTLTVFCDCSNAFCRVDNEDTTLAILEATDDVSNSTIKDREHILDGLRFSLDDLVFTRTFDGCAVSVVTGQLRINGVPIGEVQGGLVSMLRFCIVICMRVFKILRREFPNWAN